MLLLVLEGSLVLCLTAGGGGGARPCLFPTVRSKGHVSSAVSQLAPLVVKVTDLTGEIASVLEPKHIKILTRSFYPVFLCPGIIYSPIFW